MVASESANLCKQDFQVTLLMTCKMPKSLFLVCATLDALAVAGKHYSYNQAETVPNSGG